MDFNGNVSISASVCYTSEMYAELNVSNDDNDISSSMVKGKDYPHSYMLNKGGNLQDEELNTDLKLTGTIASQIKEANIGVEAKVSIMNLDIVAAPISTGISAEAEGEYSYNIFDINKLENNVNQADDNDSSLTYKLSADAISKAKAYIQKPSFEKGEASDLFSVRIELFKLRI